MTLEGNAVIGQSGGPTVVINQSLVGCIQALRESSAVKTIYGAHHAVRGIIENDYIDTSDLSPEQLERIAVTPAAALGSSRDKPDQAYCEKVLESFEKRNIRYFFYIGGNDSSDTCRIVNEVAKAKGYELRSFHVPKTIDNDLVLNDHTPGFASAAKFVACAVAGDSLDNAALPGIKVDVIMGRHAGFLTAAAALGRQAPGVGPHLIYVPEVAFDLDKFITDVDRIYTKHGRCMIAVSEGIHDADGTPIAVKLATNVEKDAHGNVQLSGTGALGDHLAQTIKAKLGQKLRVRADTFGYLQRSFLGCVSSVDQHEAREVGRYAVRCAMNGEAEGSIIIERESENPYRASYRRVELSDVAAKTRTLPTEYIVDGCDIDEKFHDYLRPLLGEMPVVERIV